MGMYYKRDVILTYQLQTWFRNIPSIQLALLDPRQRKDPLTLDPSPANANTSFLHLVLTVFFLPVILHHYTKQDLSTAVELLTTPLAVNSRSLFVVV